MSRTVRGTRGNRDFWSRRPGNRLGANGSGSYAKLYAHRRERLAGHKMCVDGINQAIA